MVDCAIMYDGSVDFLKWANNQHIKVGIVTSKDSNTVTQLYPTISYDYDANGNITKVYENGVEKNHYVYDSLNRLIVDDNARDNYTYVYNYDACGDLLSKDFYYYGMSSDPDYRWYTISYAYNDTTWKNGVTAYQGESIVYDENGNPTTYRGHSVTESQNHKKE